MEHTLKLLLKGPMQSWGDNSRYRTRSTGSTPTKSGIVGLLAAAEGRRRTDPIEDLAALSLAVRVDQSGSLLRDYQTAQPWQKNPNDPAKLVTRYYLSDAAFLVGIESENLELLEGLQEALRNPAYPLFLGRRSCPAPANLVQGIVPAAADVALLEEDEWFASSAHRKVRSKKVELPVYRDARPGEQGERRQDVPISFDPQHRKYGWRTVVFAGSKAIDNSAFGRSHDPFMEAVMSV
ncbi:type I-E CRISPR-associated protein Cas5/CasD [Corynebacterium pilosum]|uniref:CRISPR-associated protein n=1 Tax=Corynebacterium pilosum TaxID=35756 RepID=A0A376CLV9_9CORY|nr:type I-E CRISPR-associated protein Cas5/CasD [Corynebacterium pilosum]STC69303.1 CRISPR-associated protein [Corynebacterium pilosum]